MHQKDEDNQSEDSDGVVLHREESNESTGKEINQESSKRESEQESGGQDSNVSGQQNSDHSLSITVISYVGDKGAKYFADDGIEDLYVEYNFLGK